MVATSYAVAPIITSATSDTTVAGDNYEYSITTAAFVFINGALLTGDDVAADSFGYTGTLPDGLSFDNATGVLSGIPTQSGETVLTLTALNTDGSDSITFTLDVAIPPPSVPVITSSLFVSGRVDEPFTYSIDAAPDIDSFTAVGVDGVIDGLTFDSNTGVISGTPTIDSIGNHSVQISATNISGTSDTVTLNIEIEASSGDGPTATITSVGDVLLAPSGHTFDADTATLQIIAEVEAVAGQTLESVYVRWSNPPASAGASERIIAELSSDDDPEADGPKTYSGAVTVGFLANAGELGAGAIELQVVAIQRDDSDVLTSGSSEAASFEIAPLLEFLYPTTTVTVSSIAAGELFAGVRMNTNTFQSVAATLSGVNVAESIELTDADANGVYYFEATESVSYTGAPS